MHSAQPTPPEAGLCTAYEKALELGIGAESSFSTNEPRFCFFSLLDELRINDKPTYVSQ